MMLLRALDRGGPSKGSRGQNEQDGGEDGCISIGELSTPSQQKETWAGSGSILCASWVARKVGKADENEGMKGPQCGLQVVRGHSTPS